VIGDQLLTDVLGAKLVGVDAILIEPVIAHDFVLTCALRVVERVVFRRTPS
jgi:predicted HAD superfamily phosphohydrolase YqeG